MCDCFHLAFPNWHAASSGTGAEQTAAAGAGRRLRGPEPGTEDNSICDEPPQFAEGERPRPQGSSPVEEYPETEKYSDSDKECEVEHDPHRKSGSGKKTKKSGLGSMFEKRSTPKMSKLKEVHSPESGVIVKTAKDGCAEGLIYGGGGKEGIFIKEVIPESPASKNLKLKEGDQVLSATVYFDNVSYEDAIQILEHAQAYKVKLCLKRKPDITEAEPTLESDVIPEDDVYPPEMREQGKTKRRGDARISWPKFPSFGKGRKSGFRRSHSSSEADEQRKLELSPTTSDTESPIKSQDALKGKKKHKIKLPTLSKRGRISSSEDQDTDAPTSGQISGNILQTHESDMLSPDGLESPSGETPEVYVTQKLKEVEELRHEQNDQKLTEPQTVQHKVELITIGSTLKTEDLTVALAGQESPSGKSPDGKKKKKEKSELKMKILGKDKSHKKDAKAKSSPKRLKTLGASFEITDQPEVQKSDVIPSFELQQQAKSETMQIEMSAPKVEFDTSDVAFVQKSPRKGEEKTKKGKDKQKHEAKTSPTFKLPKVGFSNITTEETIQKINVNVEESTAKIDQLTTESTEVKEDPYERLSKDSISGTKLPKREDIEIPGMEDMSKKTKAKGIKEPKAVFSGHHEEIQAETVQLSIDVDSVKEAVSKLPGFKLPKVDDSGVPIPEDITVIDANAQRISVKTPTKVVDTKAKHEAHFTKFDITASPDISKTTIKDPKIPKIATPDLTSDELLTETKVDLKETEKKQKSKAQQSGKDIKTEVYEREHIIIPGKESTQEEIILQTQVTEESDKKSKKAKITAPSFGIAKPDIKIPNIGIDFPKQNIAEDKINVEGERTMFHQKVKTSKTETRKGKGQTEGVVSDVKIPEIDGIEYIDSVDGLSAKKDGGIRFTGVGVNLEATKPSADISLPEIRGEVKHVEVEHTIKTPKFGVVTPDISVQVPDSEKDINIDGAEIKREGSGSKFKIPNLGISMPKVKGPKIDLNPSKKNIDVTLPEGKAEGKLPEVPEVDIPLRNVDVSIPTQKMEVEKAELDIKPLQTEGEPDGQGGRFKMPKFGIKMPKIKGPEIDLSSSKKNGDISEAEANIQIPDDANISVDIKQQESEAKMEVQESKFRMPKLGIAMPKTKGPEIDSSLNKKDKDLNLPEAKAEVKVPDVELTKPSAEMEITAPEIKVPKKDAKISPSKFKMPTFKLPKFGVGMPSATVEMPDKEAKIDGADIKIPEEVLTVEIAAPSIDTEGKTDIDIKTIETEHEGKGGKFKMPKFGISLPKMKGPEIDLSISKKDVDVTLPEAKAEVKLPEVRKVDVSFGKEVSLPEEKLEELELKSENELDGQGGKFKMPKLAMSMPKLKEPEIHFGLSKKDGDVTLPEAKAEVKVPEAPEVDVSLGKTDVSLPEEKLEVKNPELKMESEIELDGQGGKFKMPKLGMSMPKLKGPEIHFGLSKKDGDVTLPEAKAEIEVPKVELKEPSVKVEMKAPEITVPAKGTEGSPTKFKMPSFKLPKFGLGTPTVSAEVPDLDKDVRIDGGDINIPEEGSAIKISAPSIDIEAPSIDIKTTATEQDGKESKFKISGLGFSMPKVKGPKIDLSLSKKDVDVTVPEAKADVKLPEANLGEVDVSIPEVKMELPEAKATVKLPEAPQIAVEMQQPECDVEMGGHDAKFKMPKFGIKMPKVKGPEFDLSLSKKDADVKVPEVDLEKVDVSIPEAKMEVKKPELEMQTEGEFDGKTAHFKMPKFGIKMPKIQGPDIDLSLSKKDVDVTLPQTKTYVKLPDAPQIDVKLGKTEVSIPGVKVDGKKPELEIKPLQTELEGQGTKFKMPKFEMVMPKVKGPTFHTGFSKKDVDVTLPEAKADVSLPDVQLNKPSATLEIKAPEIEVVAKDTEGSPFSMPNAEGPALSFPKKDTDITLQRIQAEAKLPRPPKLDASLGKAQVLIPEAKVEVKKPEVKIESLKTSVELEEQESKFKMPKFGISLPKVKGPEIDLSFSKKDADVTLPETKAEVKLPEAPKMDVKLGKVDVSIPEAKMEIEKPQLEIKPLQSEGELDGQGSKYKMPKFGISMPKVKGPEIDFGLSKKDGDVTLPEAKAEVSLPDVEPKEPSAEVETEAPEAEGQLSSMKGSPSKFKMPTFKFPKFGVASPNVIAELPDMDKEIKSGGGDMNISVPPTDVDIPKVKAEVHVPEIKVKEPSGVEADAKLKKPRFSLPRFSFSKPTAKVPEADVSLPDVNVAIPEGKVEVKVGEVDKEIPECEAEVDRQGSKFKMPKFGITMPKLTGPEIDLSLSKKDVNVTLPEAKAEVKLPDVELEKPSTEVEIKAPEIKVAKKDKERSPLKLNMPTVKLPKFGVGMPSATAEVPDKEAKLDGADIKIPEEVLTVEIAAPSIDMEVPSIDMKTTEAKHEGKGGKFEMPKFGITMPKVKGPEIDLNFSKKNAKAEGEIKLPDVELKEPSAKVEIKAPEIATQSTDIHGPSLDVKMTGTEEKGGESKFKVPKFGISLPKVQKPEIDVSLSKKGDVKLTETEAEVKLPEAPKVDVSLGKADVSLPEKKMEVEKPDLEMQSEVEVDGQGSKFKMPKLGMSMPKVKGPEIHFGLSKKDVDVTLPEAKAEVSVPDIELKKPSAEVEITAPEIKVTTKDKEGSPSKFKMPTFKLPKFGVGMPSATVEVPDKEAKIDGADVKIPEDVLTVEIAAPSIDTEGKSVDIKTTGTEHEGKGGKFKMPKFGVSVPKVTGPEIDISLSKKDVDVTLPEAKAEVKVTDVELKKPSAEVEITAPEIKVATKDIKESPSRFKMPTFKLPKFGVGMPSATVEMPDKEAKIDGADIKKPEEVLTVEIAAPSIDTEGKSIDIKTTGTEYEGKGGKFKMPKFGVSVPKVTGPEIDISLSKKDVDVTLPEAKAEVKVTDAELKKPSAEVKITAPEIKVVTKDKEGSPSKFKMPTFKLPKFGVGMPSATVEMPDKEPKIDGADVKIPEDVLTVEIATPSIDTEGKSIDIKTTGTEHEGKGGKFKMPKFGVSVPKVTGPEIDISLSKKDVDVTLPEAKAEVKVTDAELKKPSAEVKITAPEIKVVTKDKEGSPSKFKMPTFKLPKFGVGMPSATVEMPDKEPKIDGADVKIPEDVLTVEIATPSIDTEGKSIDIKTTGTEHEGKGGKFKMPKFGVSVPKVTGPEIDISLSKKDVDVTLPEAKAEVKVTDAELKKPSAEVKITAPEIKVVTKDKEGSPSKFKMPTFKLPKFGVGMPSATVEMPDKEPKIDGADVKIPEDVLTVEIATPSIDTEGKSIDIKTTGTEHEGKGGKFKMPKFGVSVPKVTGPEIDLSLSKKDVDVTLPEAKAEVKVTDVELKKPSAEVEITAPEIKVATKDTKESPSRFKMPTFKLPKFGVGMPSATVEMADKESTIDGADIKKPEEVLTVEIAAPSIDTEGKSIDIKTTGTEHEGKGGKFKMPKFGVTLPKVTGPEIDLSLSKKDVDITLPEAKAEVKLADAPKVDISLGKAEVSLPEEKLEVKKPELEMESETELDGQGGKFKMPKLGMSMPKVKGPQIHFGLSKKDGDVTLPEAKAEIKVADAELKKPSAEVEITAPEIKVVTKDKEGSPSKFKMPTFKLPKFGVGMPSATVEMPDKEATIDGADVKIPEDVLTVETATPSIDTEGKSIDIKTTETEYEGKGGKFKMPKFGVSVPKVTGPEIDLSLSKKDVDVTLPDAKAEVKVTDTELKKPSAEVEITAPDIKVAKKDKEGSPSKFKMPTFKLPKFGVGMPSATVEMADKEAKIDGADIKIPEDVLTVEIAAPSIDAKGKSIDIKTTGTEHEGKGGKFKMPKFGITMPKVTGPETDLSISKKDVDVTLPEAKAEVKVPEAELKKPFAAVEITAPGIDIQTGTVEGSPSKFKMPTFTLPKFGGATPQVSVEPPDVDKQIKLAGADFKLPEAKGEVTLPDVKMKEPVTSVSVPQAEGDAKVKKTRFSLPRFSFSKQSTTEHEVDASLPDTDVSLPEGKMEVKHPEVELLEGGVELDKQESKFKMPKFGISMPKVKGPEIDLNLSKKDVGVTLPEAKAEVQLLDVEIKQSSAKVKIKAPQIEAQAGKVEGSPSNIKMPSLTLPKFGADSSKISVEVPDVDKDIKIDGANLSVPKKGATVDVTATSTDTEGLSVDVKAKESETQGSGSKFKMPNFGISMPKVKGPDLSISKKDVDVTLPEVKAETKLPDVEVKEPEAAISVLDAPQVEVEAKSKKPNWTFPKFSFSRTGGKAPDVDVNLEAPKVGVTSPEAEAETGLPNVEVQGPSGAISVEEPPAVKARFSLPRFSFSKSSGKEPEDSAEPPHVDVSLPEGEVIVKQPEMEIKAPELETGQDGQGSKFKLPKFGITLPKTKGPEEDLNASKKDIDITLPEVKAEVKLPENEVKKSSASVEIKASDIEAKSKDVGGSPLKFKMPTVKMLKFGVTTSDVTIEAPDVAKVDETDGAKLKDDDTVGIKGVSVDIKTDVSKAAITDPEMPKTETDSVGLGSPSKFKLFKMPKLSFSKSKPEDETTPAETESKEDQMETEDELKGESKSPKMTLTSFGEILKNIDVEFDIPKTENEEEPGGNQLEEKEKETLTKQDAIKSPERTGWFKFPKFGLSSPSEPAKTPEKDKDEKSPTVDEEISPTSSVRSSDAFADVSSAMTSEHAGLSLSSPTKVTVKYSDPDVVTGHGEMHSNIITSTTRTEMISVEPNLPEKITILSSGVSSSSEDTLRLDSGKIHVITSNIQATPESQHAKLLAAIQVQPAGGLPPQSEATEAASWTAEESKSGKRTVFERHLVRETSSEKSESKETIVITKQITRMLDSSEPISDETASSIQRLKDSVHSEKMKFFDGAEK